MGWLEGGVLSRNQAVRTSSNGIPQNPGNGKQTRAWGGSYPSSRSSPEETQEPKRGPDTQSQPRPDSGSCFLHPRLRGKGSGRTDRPRGLRFKPPLLGPSPLPPLEKARLLGVSGLEKEGETWHALILSGYQTNVFPSHHANLQEDRAGTSCPPPHTRPSPRLSILRCSMYSKRIPKSPNKTLPENLIL